MNSVLIIQDHIQKKYGKAFKVSEANGIVMISRAGYIICNITPKNFRTTKLIDLLAQIEDVIEREYRKEIMNSKAKSILKDLK